MTVAIDKLIADPAGNLPHFVAWGGKPWLRLVKTGIWTYLEGELNGKQLLEIGPGSGRMSCLFALLGAQVTGLEISRERLDECRRTAEKFGVKSKIELILYEGDPSILAGRKFDIIFSKSALIYPLPLDKFLNSLEELLKDSGKVVFIENARGSLFAYALRFIKRRSLSFFRRVHYFSHREIDLVKQIFQVELIARAHIPPIYLICGKKKGPINNEPSGKI